jgi:hypothetical protein
VFGPKVTLRGVQHSERLWPARLRWRLRGAWMWPAYFGLTAVDAVLLVQLPPYQGGPDELVGGVLLAGFANLLLLAVAAPFAGRLLRRRRRDLPRTIAYGYAGTALLVALTAVLLVAGLAHRPAAAGERDDAAALSDAVRAYVSAHAPDWEPGLDGVDVRAYAPDVYRVCVPGPDPRRALCLIVDTDRRPVGVVRDDSMEPNAPAGRR